MSGTVAAPVRSRLQSVAGSLRLAWPVFVVFLGQRLLTLGFVRQGGGDLHLLVGRWDAGWYLRLAEGGYVYPRLAPDGSPRASNLAYFPLFPWLGRQLADVTPLSLGQALVVVSWTGGLLAVWAIFAVGNALHGRGAGIALAALWGTAPASLTLTMGYPEGLFTAAAAATLLCLIRRQPVGAGLCAVVAGLLRPSAVAVIATVGVYFLVELGRWLLARRATAGDRTRAPDGRAAPDAEATPDVAARPAVRPAGFPVGALVGAVLSTLGLGAFMVYVGARTGHLFGYFTVQGQWGQRTAGPGEYWPALAKGLFGSPPATLVPVTIAVAAAYLVLFCLIVFDRRLGWASVYAAVMLLLSLTHVTFQHVYARQLLPAFVLLIPLVRLRVVRIGAIAALTLGSVLMSWGSAQFLLTPGAGM